MATTCPSCGVAYFVAEAELVDGNIVEGNAVHENTCVNGHVSYHDLLTDTQYEELADVPAR